MSDEVQPDPPRRRLRAGAGASWQDIATALLPVLACFLGGATEKWAEGIVVAFLGVLLLASPPRDSLGPAVNVIFLALLATAGVAFLPASWFFQPEWRQALVNDFGIGIASTVTPQPWITAGAFASMVAGMSWVYFVASQEAENRAVRQQFRLFALGVVLLAGLSMGLYYAQQALPFWHNQRGFGPFPNRNQMANLLGLTAVIILACGQDDLRQGRKRWVVWLAALAVVITAIVLNFSRAGIAILVAGSVLWVAILVVRQGSVARIAVGASVLLGLLTVLLVFGGATLERFNLRAAEGTGLTSDFRWLIFQDAWQLIRSSPWVGIGLGNFEPLFAIFRDASFGQTRALHPESDWLWLVAELGWPAAALILVGGVLLLRRVFPLSDGTNQRFRLAALVAAVLFALHALADVSGHRVGSAYAGLFLFGLALRRPEQPGASRALVVVFRLIGAALLVIGGTWVIASYGSMSLPGGIGADNEQRLARAAHVGRRAGETIDRTTRALVWEPLNWQLYFLRALGKVTAQRPPHEAVDDFRRARFLEPNSYEVPYHEGAAWLRTQPTLAVTAWREALRRAGPERAELYSRMLSAAQGQNLIVRQMLEEFGSVQPDLALAYLERSQGDDFASGLTKLLRHDPALQMLTPEQKRRLFALWSERGDVAWLSAYTQQHPELLSFAWRGVAKHHASRKEFRAAYELAQRSGPAPKIPVLNSTSSIEELQREFFSSPNDPDAGLALYQQQIEGGKPGDALLTLRRLTEQPGVPAYFHFLEAQAWAAQENWERAWQAWLTFDRARGN
ncbi:hypothetical protein BH20VER2_BH20VER2_06310 [soil metagenome]